jgi:hypothetical protein
MSLMTDLYSFLSDSTPLTAVVNQQIYPCAAPETVNFPFLTFEIIRTNRAEGWTNDGYMGLCFRDIQFMAWSNSYAMTDAIAEALRFTLIPVTNTDMGQTHIFQFDFENELDIYAPPEHGQDLGYFGRQVNVIVKHLEKV